MALLLVSKWWILESTATFYRDTYLGYSISVLKMSLQSPCGGGLKLGSSTVLCGSTLYSVLWPSGWSGRIWHCCCRFLMCGCAGMQPQAARQLHTHSEQRQIPVLHRRLSQRDVIWFDHQRRLVRAINAGVVGGEVRLEWTVADWNVSSRYRGTDRTGFSKVGPRSTQMWGWRHNDVTGHNKNWLSKKCVHLLVDLLFCFDTVLDCDGQWRNKNVRNQKFFFFRMRDT